MSRSSPIPAAGSKAGAVTSGHRSGTTGSTRRRRPHFVSIIVLIVGVLALSACASPRAGDALPAATRDTAVPASDRGSSPPARQSPVSPPVAATPYPNAGLYTSAGDRIAYSAGYTDCSALSPDGLASGYGGDAKDPASLARAYAVGTVPAYEAAAERGCLDGMQARSDRMGS
jgi:hypothetical protein